LIPGESIINKEAVVPGLVGEKFPAPNKDPKKDNDPKFYKPVPLNKPVNMFIHNIEVVGSRKIEDFLCKTLAKMFVDKKMNGQGIKRDPEDINVEIVERKVNVMVHNTWRQVSGETRSSTL
jgi:hypothetical protein